MQKPQRNKNLTTEIMPRRSSSSIAATNVPGNTSGRKISRDTLTNQLNYLHFQDRQVAIVLQHKRHKRLLRLQAHPAPCFDENVTFRWADDLPGPNTARDYGFHHLEVSDGSHHLLSELTDTWFDETELHGKLPELGHRLTARSAKRHYGDQVKAQLIQNGTVFEGRLADFNANAFRLDLSATPPQTFHWLTTDDTVTILLKRGNETLLSTTGTIQRRHGGDLEHTVVIKPGNASQRRFPSRKYRAPRHQLRPNPTVVIKHPLTAQTTCLNIADISGAGFAVIEAANEASLVPGMIIPDMELSLAGILNIRCTAQVIHRHDDSECEQAETVSCGLAILDMSIEDHNRLLNLLNQAENRRHFVCSDIDMDQLWEFFFQSGFIYPQKYKSIEGYKQQLKDSYTRLYTSAPDVARHFVYRDHNVILGHMAMLRLFKNSWMIHHHAADSSRSRNAGLDTLRMAGEAANVAQTLYSSHMHYAVSYYRPENRFPHRVFGGVVGHYDDPKQCSIDTFAYFHYRKEFDMCWKDSGPWELAPAHNEELAELEAWYEEISGGLLLEALDLKPGTGRCEELTAAYSQAGFQWERLIFSLQRDGVTTAIFMVLRTELGLNFSSLNNAITVLVTDPERLPREAFYTAVSMLASKYPVQEVPIMVYPESYAQQQKIEIDKSYNFWAIDCRKLDPYFEYCDNLFRRIKRKKSESS